MPPKRTRAVFSAPTPPHIVNQSFLGHQLINLAERDWQVEIEPDGMRAICVHRLPALIIVSFTLTPGFDRANLLQFVPLHKQVDLRLAIAKYNTEMEKAGWRVIQHPTRELITYLKNGIIKSIDFSYTTGSSVTLPVFM
jgi:hypothetical protein